MDQSENIPSNPRIQAGAASIHDVIETRLSRRGVLGGLVGLSTLAVAGCATRQTASESASTSEATFNFAEITRGMDGTHHLPSDYTADVLIRWGDPLFKDSAPYDPASPSEADQLTQFGYNNDYIGFIPMDADKDGRARALLCVHHEYTTTPLMLPNVAATYPASMTAELCRTEMAAHGGSVVEIIETAYGWKPVVGSKYNRRITAHTTPMTVTGPAAGSARLATSQDPDGLTVAGTMNNCAGGTTPWGTWLMSEENFNGNFLGELPDSHPEAENHKRYGVPSGWYQWGRFEDRFNVAKEPNEPNRFGWIVEVDPFDPTSQPKKRTALGRFKHEGAENIVAPDGRVVIYMGDDQRFDYVYKFVTRDAYDPDQPDRNKDLLDHGTLYVARFDANGSVAWLPLIHGEGPLTAQNGFNSQADVLIETRRAADLLEATPMDRPEDVEPDPATGKVWVMLTNNHRREEDQINAANPRAANMNGHIIEITEPNGDFTATTSRWDILVRCGNPDDPAQDALWNPETSENGWFGSPDNCAIDPSGRLWVATDGNEKTGSADGLWAMETTGERRGTSRAFFRAPAGAEVCGPKFSPDGRTLFVAVQHPGDTDKATFENPGTRWPDFQPGLPPRPSILAIRRKDGGVIGA